MSNRTRGEAVLTDGYSRIFYEKRMSQEVAVDSLGDEWKGYVFRITGGNDKQGAFVVGQKKRARADCVSSICLDCFSVVSTHLSLLRCFNVTQVSP